jgi:hypothetical protein
MLAQHINNTALSNRAHYASPTDAWLDYLDTGVLFYSAAKERREDARSLEEIIQRVRDLNEEWHHYNLYITMEFCIVEGQTYHIFWIVCQGRLIDFEWLYQVEQALNCLRRIHCDPERGI